VSVVRRTIKAIYLRFLYCSGLLKWARSRAARRGIVVLTLHQVLPDANYESAHLQPGMALRASSFQRLLKYLTRHCHCVLPTEAISARNGGKPAGHGQPQVALTFDDGWKDNFEVALPISQKYGVRFTVFICPEIIAEQLSFWPARVNRLWWAAERAGRLDRVRILSGSAADSAQCLIENLKRLKADERERLIEQLEALLWSDLEESAGADAERLLTWPDIKTMAGAGIAFGSHTNTHPILTDLEPEEAARELSESRSAIEKELDSCDCFAYPNGDWSQPVRELAAKAGYQLAFANSPGIWEANSDRFSIPRVNVWEGSFTGLTGRFSRIALEYAIFWKACRARREL
jgi:peptidoglycan/xylan/chitin deacetylase (PgdA/CDA1 family)